MQIDFGKPILDIRGRELDENGTPWRDGGAPKMTLGSIAAAALLRDDGKLAGAEKVRRYKLAMQVVEGGVVDLPVERVSEIKTEIGIAFPPLMVGRAYEIIGD